MYFQKYPRTIILRVTESVADMLPIREKKCKMDFNVKYTKCTLCNAAEMCLKTRISSKNIPG